MLDFKYMSRAALIGLVFLAFSCTKSTTSKTSNNSKGTSSMEVSGKQAVIQTSMGTIEMEFLPEVAPKHVENFIKLSKDNFYDGTTFHRVIPGFMVQGGDPNSKNLEARNTHGTGGPGYNIDAEFSDQKHTRGIVSMARSSDPNSAGSQFFVVVQDSVHLDGQYTAFGKVTKGMDVVDEIVKTPRDGRDNPLTPVIIKDIEIK